MLSGLRGLHWKGPFTFMEMVALEDSGHYSKLIWLLLLTLQGVAPSRGEGGCLMCALSALWRKEDTMSVGGDL